MSNPRFSYSDPPHPANAALIDWHVYDEGERISVSRLVHEANRLQKELDQLKAASRSSNIKSVKSFD
jgi:hypothetical protein